MKDDCKVEITTVISAADGDEGMSLVGSLTAGETKSLRAETRAGIQWMRQVIRSRPKHPETAKNFLNVVFLMVLESLLLLTG
ncbi:hypothetical protein [Shewanella algae]|uniref:hypothetical protein n=1 Tax=Shewanella algae TaxID=38313 RepID=UPI0012DEC0EE|nr:hypothetical protein [Shewanella algae]QGS60572.1 hypothetical protein GMX02_14280 [Shewanella algae]